MARSLKTRFAAGSALVCVLLLTGGGRHFGAPAAAQDAATETLRPPGLQAPVEIITDRWGISHIYAENEHDLFFAQGYAAARDRLFQFELWRRQATGTVAEILGPRELERDIGARLFQFRGDMTTEMRHYHDRGDTIIPAFVDGINAYIARTEQEPDLLPIEFRLLGITPGRWTPEVVVSRHQGLVANVTSEIDRARAVAELGPDAVKELNYFIGDPDLTLDPAIDASLLSDAILDRYRAHRRPVRFEPEDITVAFRGDRDTFERLAAAMPSELDLRGQEQDAIGSNNWVVHGTRTLSGYPIMANDPHRAQSAPSLRYWVHLVAPGWNVIGGGEPVLPGVSIGHNEHGAWGLTVFGQDNEDLYVYETNPANPNQYRYLGGWESMTVRTDTIPVKGQADAEVELKYTRHGPVVHEDTANNVAYAVRAAWLDYGSAPYLASLRMDQATTWEEFVEACNYSRIPSENMVWADRAGNIGYQAVGVSPIRPNHSGLVPVPGDGRYEWDGFLPIKALPSVHNPDKGYFGTANNYVLLDNPATYPHWEALHYTWGDQMRAARVEEVLANARHMTVIDNMRLQMDELSVAARNLVPLLRDVPGLDDRSARARDMLLNWDAVLDRDSVEAAIYVSWNRALRAAVRDVVVPESVRDSIGGINTKRMIDWLTAPDGRFGDDPIAGRDRVLRDTLAASLDSLEERFGTTETTTWRYGGERFKHALIRHPMSAAVNEDLRRRLDVGPLPRGGYGGTVHNTGNGDNQTSGGSFMLIADTADWDNSVGLNTPGQSGDPDNPHYRDLFEVWARDRYVPIFYSREKIDSVTESVTHLQPAGAPTSGVDGQ
ncbi:MAG: penicillin acylase family protein [Acidobacteria bacterium]|nr:penicillin acylase family protein [Acidobacteriota bacterium]